MDLGPVFTPEGLVLGAGTVLAPAGVEERSIELDGAEERLLALASIAYERRIGVEALAHIRRAAACWREGDEALAGVHLALAQFGRLPRGGESARRLFLAARLIESGVLPPDVMRAAGLNPSLTKYRPDQPRVPAGSGRPSGEWTGDGGVGSGPTNSRTGRAQTAARHEARPHGASSSRHLGHGARSALAAPTAAPKTIPFPDEAPLPDNETEIGGLDAANDNGPIDPTDLWSDVGALTRIASDLSGPAVFFNVLLTPTPIGGKSTIIDIPGHPDLRLVSPAMETHWYIESKRTGQRLVGLRIDGQTLVDKSNRAVGRFLPNGRLALDLAAAVSPHEDEEPRLCPLPSPDNGGSAPGSVARAYEDQIKMMINPQRPTPSGFGVALLLASRFLGMYNSTTVSSRRAT